MSWIVRLEDQRVLRDPSPPPAPPPPVTTGRKQAIATPPPPPVPDLTRLLRDTEGRVRRRAALAIGRVGLRDGVEPLVALLADREAEVRQMAAFAIGLIGDASGGEPLVRAVADASPLVKGSAAEALGLLGYTAAAPAIARMASDLVGAGAIAEPPSDQLDGARDSAAAAIRLACYALVRLKAYEALASAVLDASGQPRSQWWPIAYALQRLEDPRALPALLALVKAPHPYTRAFAAKGLGAMKDPSAAAALLPLLDSPDKAVLVEALRSLGRLHDRRASAALLKIVSAPGTDPQVRLEAVGALGAAGGDRAFGALVDLIGDPAPPIRAAAIQALAQLDRDAFITILSGLDDDPHWTVRAALATVLGSFAREIGLPRLRGMLGDPDARVVAAALAGMSKHAPPDAATILVERLKTEDPVVRAAAANGLGALKPQSAAGPLRDAYRRSEADATYVARAAILSALAACEGASAAPILSGALSDKDWAVRRRAATLLRELDPAADTPTRMRPAPSPRPELYDAAQVVAPQYSTQAYIETARGTIQLELSVLDAPLTVENFVRLARANFFNGIAIHRIVPNFVVQAGDPRGDGEGGPGYSIRDELNQQSYLRGVVGMALDWADTSGSQFFITLTPQPHLDAKYTAFGRVVSGMDVVDQLEAWDVIERVRIWDGGEDGNRD
jgi:HEAT repeat protein/cyclophilin family peptidyl-prolyl cis-trans isomerase